MIKKEIFLLLLIAVSTLFTEKSLIGKTFIKENYFDLIRVNTAIDKDNSTIAQNNFSRNDKNLVIRVIVTNPKKKFDCELKLFHYVAGNYQKFQYFDSLHSNSSDDTPETDPTPEPDPSPEPDPELPDIYPEPDINLNDIIEARYYNSLKQNELDETVEKGIDDWISDNYTYKNYWFSVPIEKFKDGQWRIKLYIKSDDFKNSIYVDNINFFIRYNNKIESVTCRSLTDEHKPIGISDKFYTTEREVYIVNKITYISDNLNIKWIYYHPDGKPWYEYDGYVSKDNLEFLNQIKYYNEIFANNRHSMLDHREKKLTGKFKVVTCIKDSISGKYEEITTNSFEIIENSSIDIKFTKINEASKTSLAEKKDKIDLNKKIKAIYELTANIQNENFNFYDKPNYIDSIIVYWKDADGEGSQSFSKIKTNFFKQKFTFQLNKSEKFWFEVIAYDRFGYKETCKYPLSTITKNSDSMFMKIAWFLNGKNKKVIPDGFKGKIVKLHSWWGNHGLKVDLNNDQNFEHVNYDLRYNKCDNPNTCVDYASRDFTFNNGFSLNDFFLWVGYWHDPTHGKIKCYRNDCIYDPYGAGATFEINSRDFKCLNNEWHYQNDPILSEDGNVIYCRQFNVCGDGIITENEECDDFNQNNGDGCSSECKNE